jgi:hypothetical protein
MVVWISKSDRTGTGTDIALTLSDSRSTTEAAKSVFHRSKTETFGSTTSDTMSVSVSGLTVCNTGLATDRPRNYSVLTNVKKKGLRKAKVFRNVTWRRLVASYWYFATTYQYHFQWSSLKPHKIQKCGLKNGRRWARTVCTTHCGGGGAKNWRTGIRFPVEARICFHQCLHTDSWLTAQILWNDSP